MHQFNRFLYVEKKYFDQYASSVYRIIRTFFRYLFINRALPVYPFYRSLKAPAEQFIPVVLTPDRLKRLVHDHEFVDSLRPSLRKVRDLFVIGSLAGLRYSDLMNLKRYHLKRLDNRTSLVLHTQKTGQEVSIPLPKPLLDILYSYKVKSGFLLPRISNTNFNVQVKKLIETAGWIEPIPKFGHRQGKVIEIKKNGESFRFCDHVTAHTMRRTAITCLLMMGLEESLVRKISGHAPASKEFYKYVVLSQSYLDDKVRLAQQKLLFKNGGS